MARRYYGRDRTARGKPRPAHLTAWTRASNIAGMHEGVPAASKKADVSLVEMERQLESALTEYERLCQAWPKESHVLSWSEAGREMEDALARIGELPCRSRGLGCRHSPRSIDNRQMDCREA